MISMLLVLFLLVILDGYNPAMGFLNSNVSKVFYLALGIIGLINAASLVLRTR
ncbi:MAG: hypothetical protein IJT43_01700 [Stomatobaculum sp.]|nr:hypothetical protein [Stomatobaculum sp.]